MRAKAPKVDGVVLTHQGAGGETVIVLSGKLGADTATRLIGAVLREGALACQRLRLDVRRVTGIDTAGLQALIACRRLAAGSGVELVLARPSRHVADWLRRTGLSRVIPVDYATGSTATSNASGSGTVGASRSATRTAHR